MNTTITTKQSIVGIAALVLILALILATQPATAALPTDTSDNVDSAYVCAYFGTRCPARSCSPQSVGVIPNTATADVIQDLVWVHKKTGKEYISRNFDGLSGPIYRNTKTGEYVAADYLEEVTGAGIVHVYTGEIILTDEFDQVQAPVYYDRESGLFISEQGMTRALRNAVAGVQDDIKSYVEYVDN